jgi:hypothetical protein
VKIFLEYHFGWCVQYLQMSKRQFEVKIKEYPVFGHSKDPVINEIIEFCNQALLKHADHQIISIAKECWPEKTNFEKEFKNIQTLCHIQAKDIPHRGISCTFDKNNVWLDEKLVNRAKMLDHEENSIQEKNEGKLIKTFLSYCLAHEMAHVIVRWKIPSNKQQLANTSPSKLTSRIPEFSYRPESGWFLEEFAFNGISSLLMKRGAKWNSKSRKVLSFAIDNDKGFSLIDEKRILNMWRMKKFRSFNKLIAAYNYKIKPNEIARKTNPHNDIYQDPKSQIMRSYIPKADEIIFRRNRHCCSIRLN